MIIRTPDSAEASWDPGPLVDRIDHDCEYLFGYPECMGAAARRDCTCRHLTPVQHEKAEAAAHAAAKLRRGRPCADCPFRSRKLDDRYELRRLAEQPGPHRCHVMVPLAGVGGEPQRDSFMARSELYYPVCDGWLAMRRRLFGVRELALIK